MEEHTMTYSERLCAAQDAALERAYMASLEPGDYYYSDKPDDEDQDRPEEEEA
jgi:hypothetical protein